MYNSIIGVNWAGEWLNDVLAIDDRRDSWAASICSGLLNGGAHLVDYFFVMFLLLFSDEMIKPVGARTVKHIDGIIGFSIEFITHG